MAAATAKSLDQKLAAIAAGTDKHAFILADAKDADMAMGLAAPGRGPQSDRVRTLQEYRSLMRGNVAQGLVDIMLTSASSLDALIADGLSFADSTVTPAIRANDATDIWFVRGGAYAEQPSRPFRTANLGEAMHGAAASAGGPPRVDLGLYSITFNNCVERDSETLSAYREFRTEAAGLGFRHFLEVFNPNQLVNPVEDMPAYVNDSIVRTLAGISDSSRPVFLKVAYNGPAAMEQLAGYDSRLIIGILGGAAGATYDAFHQLCEAKKYGARAALYGRMINQSEHQPTFIQHLRWIADGDLADPAEAVRSYHASLSSAGIRPRRTLEVDLQPTRRA